jgi:hypothetical protein
LLHCVLVVMMMVMVVSGKCRHRYGQQHKAGH